MAASRQTIPASAPPTGKYSRPSARAGSQEYPKSTGSAAKRSYKLNDHASAPSAAFRQPSVPSGAVKKTRSSPTTGVLRGPG